MKIAQLTDNISGSSIGRYSIFLHEATTDVSKLFFFSLTHTFNLDDHITGFTPSATSLGSGWLINTHFRNLLYRSHIRYLKKFIGKEGGIHYVTHIFQPITGIMHSTATIHDVLVIDMPENYSKEFVRFGLSNLREQKKLPYLNVFSVSLARRLVDLGFSGHIDVVPFPFYYPYQPTGSKAELRKEFGLPLNKKIILSVSSNEKRKNLSRVKDAMKELGDEFILLRVGPSIGIGKSYMNLDYEALNKLYNLSDALVLPSLQEGYGIPVTEALACQLPVVISRLDVFEEVAKDQAVYIDPINSHDIARGIKEAVGSFNVDPKYSSEIRKMHSKETFRNEILKHYEKVLNGN